MLSDNLPAPLDFKAPDYVPVARARLRLLTELRAEGPQAIEELKTYYRTAPGGIASFIDDWGVTYDPRAVERGGPAFMPLVLFDKQREFVEFVLRKWRNREPGLTEKSRDGGISWVCIGIACALGILHEGIRVGFGSRRADYVDKADEPKSLFWKARFFMKHLPKEFRAGFREDRDSPYMRLAFPDTGSSLVGEVGDDIGRGDRTSLYFVDEAAHLARPKLVDFALSQTTNCRIDVSSVNGMNNPFAEKRHGGRVEVFIFDWRDDPRKDDAWYKKQEQDLDPIVVAQEIDRDYQAAVEGVVIPRKWLDACIGALEKLGLPPPTGAELGAFDVADGGRDRNGFVGGKGIETSVAVEWAGGKGSDGDIFQSVERVFALCDENGIPAFRFDGDGLGAGVRGDARIINERRERQGQPVLGVEMFRGSEAVLDPNDEDVKGRKNEDMFLNRKAQGWWRLRLRALKTYRWVEMGIKSPVDEIMSFRKDMPNLQKLLAELAQPQYKTNDIGKLYVVKTPDDMKSPNMGDATMMKYSGAYRGPMIISPDVLARSRIPTRRRQ